MKLTIKIGLSVIIFIAVSTLFLQGIKTKESADSMAMVGEAIPNFALPDLYQPTGKLTNQLFYKQEINKKSSLTMLNVWASWCVVCKKEHSFLKQLASKKFDIIGLNYRDKRSSAQDELVKAGDPYRAIIFDDEGRLALDLGVYGTPTTFLINANGKILHRYTGALNESIWEREFAKFYLFSSKRKIKETA